MTHHASARAETPSTVSFRQAFMFWLKLGFISFGGPAGQISIMHTELVERRRWISEMRFLHALNYCMLLPGPEAQQLATYIGWLMHRTWGGVVAGVLFILPSLFILMALSWLYLAFGQMSWVAGLFYGVKPAVTALVFQAVHRVGSRVLKNPLLWGIAGASFLAMLGAHVPFALILVSAAMLGYVCGRIRPQSFQTGAGHGHAAHRARCGALIDDDTPTPAHAQFRWLRLAIIAGAGALLWIAPFALLMSLFGWEGPLTQMAWFFTKAALLTFGGAYAVLPYVVQGAVGHYGWLTPTQMIDGLALGETTPGPLIMVVAFVAFAGGYQSPALQTQLGQHGWFWPGAVAALIASWFTFLPSFLLILAGGPLVEATHGDLKLTAPMTAITAAVVGVILNLALYFGHHVLWPAGFDGQFDLVSATLVLLAGVALFLFKRSVVQVILGCAFAGLLVHVFR